jgi:hypothetical protein
MFNTTFAQRQPVSLVRVCTAGARDRHVHPALTAYKRSATLCVPNRPVPTKVDPPAVFDVRVLIVSRPRAIKDPGVDQTLRSRIVRRWMAWANDSERRNAAQQNKHQRQGELHVTPTHGCRRRKDVGRLARFSMERGVSASSERSLVEFDDAHPLRLELQWGIAVSFENASIRARHLRQGRRELLRRW